MLRRSVFRLASLSLGPAAAKFSTLQPTPTSSAEQFYARLRNHGANLERTLASIRVEVDSSCVSEVLRRCSADRSIPGLRFFIWAGTQSRYKHSSYMYSKACETFRVHQDPGIILDVIKSYRAEECSVNVKTFKVVLNLCRAAKLADEALWVLRKMPDFNLGADTVVYNTVIRLFIQKGDMDAAEMLMKEMDSAGLRPDLVTFVEMIKGFCNVGKLKDASEVFEEMKEQGCVPNTVVYSALLDGFCRSGDLDRAQELLMEMENGGGDCRPNVVTYTSVIQSLCIQGLSSKALAVLDRMIHHGCAPNRVTIRALMDGLCAEGLIKKADEVIEQVGSIPSVSVPDCHSCLIVSLITLGELEEAERRFSRMLNCRMRPDGITCNTILRELCSKGRPLDAFLMFKQIEEAGCSSFIGSDSFSELLMGLCKLGHRDDAEKLAKLMLNRGISLRAHNDDSIVKFLKDCGESKLLPQLTRTNGRADVKSE